MRSGAVALCLVLVAACAGGPAETEVVTVMADQALVPSLETAAERAATLADAVTRYCADPGAATAETAAAAWLDAKTAWEKAELATYFGPADMLRTVSKVDYTPTSATAIDDLLASDTVIDVDFVDNKSGSTQRGLGAIEYGLHGEPSADPARVCELMTSVSEVVATQTTALSDAWTESYSGGDPWVETFTTGMTANDAMGDVIGAIVEIVKHQSLLELGKALGISAPEPEIEAIAEGPAGAGAVVYRSQLEGVRDLLDAGGESSLLTLVASRDGSVAGSIDTLLDEAIAGLSAIDGSLTDAIGARPGEVEQVYDKVSELRTLFEADVVSLLDITLGFSDTDGDSG